MRDLIGWLWTWVTWIIIIIITIIGFGIIDLIAATYNLSKQDTITHVIQILWGIVFLSFIIGLILRQPEFRFHYSIMFTLVCIFIPIIFILTLYGIFDVTDEQFFSNPMLSILTLSFNIAGLGYMITGDELD